MSVFSREYPMGRSGYMPCACRDCFEGPIIGDYNPDGSPVPTLCDGCEEHGCEIHDETLPDGKGAECRNPAAYGGGEE